jgi:DNA-binding transcriptional regulator GbsR (MarR family)
MSSDLEAVRHEFVQLWGAMAPFWGISPTTARVYSWLLSRAATADTDEIMHGLELSRGAVSMACRELRDWGLIFPEKEPGSRRVTYRPATDLEKVIRSIVQTRKRREWDPIVERLREWLPQLAREVSPDALIFRERLESMAALVARADAVIESFLKGGLVGRIGLKILANGTPGKRPGSTDTTSTKENR